MLGNFFPSSKTKISLSLMQPCNTKTIIKKLENIRKLFESNFGSENLKKNLKCK